MRPRRAARPPTPSPSRCATRKCADTADRACSLSRSRARSPALWLSRSLTSARALAPSASQHWRRLVGTGVSWLLYDIIYYGTTFNQPTILADVFGNSTTLAANCAQNIGAAAFGLPGVLIAIAFLERTGTKRLQCWGFGAIALAAIAFGVSEATDSRAKGANFAVFCVLITALNWGPNVSTFVLPAEVFPTAVRSSFFGASAAMGKVGALVGGAAFGPFIEAYGLPWCLALCAGLALAGVLISVCFVEPYGSESFCPRDRRAIRATESP